MKLVQVTKDNLREVVNLKLDETQLGFVSENVYSMAQAAVNPSYQPRAAIVEGKVVGFIMYSEWINADWATVPRPGEYYIFRVMTDKDYQGKGYGRLMMIRALEEIRARKPKAIHIGYSEVNQVARDFYQSLGFVEYGRFDWGDLAAKIEFK
ncbi:TPA: GNAT family N-acetyltransferase [Vibrio alginolyticus]